MPQIDSSTLANWLMSGFVGLVFGIIGAWVTHRLNRVRDDIAWEREKTRLQQQWQHERESLEAQFQQRLKELELQFRREDVEHLKEYILRGIDDPTVIVKALQKANEQFRAGQLRLVTEGEGDTLTVVFSKENTKAIGEMIGHFGADGEDIVMNALTLLYTIYKKHPDIKNVTVVAQSASGGKVEIPLT